MKRDQQCKIRNSIKNTEKLLIRTIINSIQNKDDMYWITSSMAVIKSFFVKESKDI